MTVDDLPKNWEHSGPGEGSSNPQGTYTHIYLNYEAESLENANEENKRSLYELEVYHDSGTDEHHSNKHHAVLRECVERLDDNGDVIETIEGAIPVQKTVEVENEFQSPTNEIVNNHEEAKERIHEIAFEIMRNHP